MFDRIRTFIRAHREYRNRQKAVRRFEAWRASELGISVDDYHKLVLSVKRGLR